MPLRMPFAVRLRALGRQLVVAAAALTLVTCTDNPTGPTLSSTVHLTVAPRFKAGTFLSPALPVDQVRLIVYRLPSCDCSPDSIAGATVPFALTDTAVTLRVPVKLTQPAETLSVQLYLMGGGQQLFFGSQSPVILTTGSVPVTPSVTLGYVGPGALLDSLFITPRDSVLTFGDSLIFAVSAFQAGASVPSFYVGWGSSLAAARILPNGQIRAPGVRAKTTVTVRAPNGKADSTTLTFVPRPVILSKVSGDAQSAPRLDTLPLPLRVLVKAADSLGVAGVRVVFHPLGTAGATVPDTIYTDSLGFAQTKAVLSDSVGTQQWQATVTGLTAVTFSATSQLLAGPPYRVKLLTRPSDTTASGALIPRQPVLQVEDSAGLPVHTAGIAVTAQTYSYLTGAPILKRPLGAGLKPSATRVTGPYKTAVTFAQITDSSDATGKVTFTALRLSGYGSERIVFNAPTLLADTSQTMWVTAGAPKTIVKGTTDSVTSHPDSLVVPPPAAIVYDSIFNPVRNAAVVFQVTAGGGTIPKPVDTVFTDTTGRAALASWTLGASPGTNTVQATTAGAGSITFTAFAVPPVPTLLPQLQGTSVVGVGRSAVLLVKLSAPAPGADTLYVANANPAILTAAPASIILATGDSVAYDTLTGVAAGLDTITVTATGYIAGVLPVTASLNLISLPPTLTVPFAGTANISVTLAAPAPVGGVVVTLVSSDSTKVKVLTPTVSFGSGVQTQNGQLSGVALGTATVTGSNPNYAPASSNVTVAANLNIVATSATIYPTFPDTQTIQFLSQGTPIAAPAGGISVTLTAADPTCVSVPATATIAGGLSSTQFTASYGGSAATPCTSQVYATGGGVGGDSVSITVGSPPTIAAGTLDLGASLQQQVNVNLGTVTTAPLTLKVRPLTLGIARFAPDLTTLGTDSLSMPVPSGTGTIYIAVSGVDSVTNDSVFVEVSMAGFKTDTALVRVRSPFVILYNVPGTTTTFSANTAIYAYIGVPLPGNTNVESYQGLRAGHAPVTATFHVTPGSVAKLVDSAGVLDTIRTAVIPSLPNVYYTPTSIPAGVGYHPIATGTTTTTVSIPGFVSLPTTTTTVVSAPTISAAAPVVGSGLQTTESVNLSAATPAATTLTVRSLKPSVLIVSDSVYKAGADSVHVPLASGIYYPYFYAQGLEGVVNDSAQVVLSVPGYTADTIWAYVRQSGVQILNMPTTTTTFTPKSQIYAGVGVPYAGNGSIYQYQPIRAGGSPLTVTFHTTPATVGKLTDSTAVQDTVRTAVIQVNPASGIYYTPTSVATGGVAYQPIGPGTSTTWATAPGYVSLIADTTHTVVSAPVIGVSQATLGSGLQTSTSISLGAATPGTDTMVIRSLNPSAIKVSPNDSTVGTDSIVAVLTPGTTYYNFYVQGMEGVISDSSAISATITGYAAGQSQSYVRQSGVQLLNVNATTTTLSDTNPVYLGIGVPYVGNSSIYQYEPLRAGSPGATFVIKVSNPTVQRLVTQSGSADSVVQSLVARQYLSPQSVATGGAALKVLTTGSDTVRVTGAGFASMTSTGTQAVTVSAPGISMSLPYAVGSGLTVGAYSYLGAAQHGGVNVVVKSSNPGVALVAPDGGTPGTDSIVVAVPNGQTSVNYFVVGVDSQVGSPIITVSANGFTDGTAALPVVQPIVDLYGVNTSQTAGGADDQVYAQLGVPYNGTNSFYYTQQRAAGRSPLSVTFTSSDSTVGTLVTQTLTASVISLALGPGFYNTPTNVATGGVAFRPLTAGTATVSASIPGYLQTVNAAGEVVTVH